MSVHPRIVVIPYSTVWPAAFETAAEEIARVLGDNLLTIHHIGSTSIPDIHAKPVIDILAIVSDLNTLDRQSAQFQQLGYEVMGEFGIPGRRYFRRNNAEGVRIHQIHSFQQGSEQVARHIAFRDFLRAHPVVATQYSELKQQLAAAHPHDMNAYMDGKDSFIKDVERRALVWAANRAADQEPIRTPHR